MDPLLAVTGLVVGLLVGLTGVGGGAIMTPALILYGIEPVVAVGTDLVYAALTKSAGVVVHQRRGNVQWPLVAMLAAGSLPGAVVTLWWLARFRADGGDFGMLLTSVLGVALVLTAVVILLRPWLCAGATVTPPRTAGRRLLTILGGGFLGALVAASSVGAGALGAALLLLVHRGLPIPRIVGTDLAHALLLATVAGIGHWQLGSVDLSLLAPLLAGSLPGVYLGARLAGWIPERVLTPMVALLLLATGIGFSLGAVH